MGNCRINIRFFMWHFQVSNNWKCTWEYNSYHKDLNDGWFAIYDFKIFKK